MGRPSAKEVGGYAQDYAVFGLFEQQAAMLSFNAAFRLLAILFVAIVPCILIWSDRPAASACQRTDFAGTPGDAHD